MIQQLNFRFRLFLYAADILWIMAALVLASWLRITLEVGAFGVDEAFYTPPTLFVVAPILWIMAFQITQVYNPRYSAWFWQEIQRVLVGHILASLLFLGTLYLTYRDYSRLQTAYFVVLVLSGIIGQRII